MHPYKAIGRAAVALLGVTLLLVTGGAAPVVSVYSDISAESCGARQGRAPREHEVVRFACRVLGSFDVEMTYHGTSVSFVLRGGDREVRLGAGYAVGDKVEWRGRRAQGRFVPQAAIIRLTSRNPAGSLISALAVIRIDAGRPCTAAVLDGSARDANAQARGVADALETKSPCGSTPSVVGRETESVRDVLERTR